MSRSASKTSSTGDAVITPGNTVPELPNTPPTRRSIQARANTRQARRRTAPPRRSQENSDVLVSAVISTYLLTHLHHVLQRAEFGAVQDGRQSQAANYAQLRKVLCMDARSMEDASATGLRDTDLDYAA
ncbi:MAG: hypothetical protein VKK03_01545 [Synechococcus sp.]|nr:hypothetical protein [Synechococcus sp.]